MTIQERINEKIKRIEDVKKQLAKLQEQIGGLSEQQRVLYNQGLEIKGQIDALVEIQMEEQKGLERSATAKLTLPEGVKPVIPDAPAADAAPVTPEAVAEAVVAADAASAVEVK